LLVEPVFAEPVPVFSFVPLSGAFFAAGVDSAGACSAGATGGGGTCPAEFAKPPASCCRESIPAAGKLSQNAIASPQASRMTVPTELFPTAARNARRKREGETPTKKTEEAIPLPPSYCCGTHLTVITASLLVASWRPLLEPSLPLRPSSPIPCRRSESMNQQH
jgi:hypothetical protein